MTSIKTTLLYSYLEQHCKINRKIPHGLNDTPHGLRGCAEALLLPIAC